MSGRAYDTKEVKKWGYVALICIALAFTTLTTTAAGSRPSDYRTYSVEKGDACRIKHTSPIPLAACEDKPRTVTIKELQNALQTAFALPRNTSWDSHKLTPDPRTYVE
jgi:hypothetical protein